MTEPRDFWLASGHHLLDRDAGGWLCVTDEFLKAYLARPELSLPSEACAAERDIHRILLAEPRELIAQSQLAAIADLDARENWQLMLDWRDFLLEHRTLETAYLEIVRRRRKFPHLFINQLVQVILRNMLDGCDDAFMLRAAELFFRTQKTTVRDGSLIGADEETVADRGAAPRSPLSSLLGLTDGVEIEVLSEANAQSYWGRSDQFDLALDLTPGRRGAKALGDVIANWIGHLLKVEVSVLPVSELKDVALTWYVGLDAEATLMGDLLWSGEELDSATQARLAGMYQLDISGVALIEERSNGAPCYLLMAISKDWSLRLKPQNLVTGLPLRQLDAA